MTRMGDGPDLNRPSAFWATSSVIVCDSSSMNAAPLTLIPSSGLCELSLVPGRKVSATPYDAPESAGRSKSPSADSIPSLTDPTISRSLELTPSYISERCR